MENLPNRTGYDFRNDPSLSATWKFRFDFFDRYGVPNFSTASPAYKEAFKALPFGQRLKLANNFFAFFFGFIYMFVLGLRRQGVIYLGATVALGLLATMLNLPNALISGIGILNVTCAVRANALYYQKKVLGQESWTL